MLETLAAIPLVGKIAGIAAGIGVVGTGFAILLKVRKLVKEVKELVERAKNLYVSTKQDKRFKLFLKDLDDVLELVADICQQLPVKALKQQAKAIRDMIKPEDYK